MATFGKKWMVRKNGGNYMINLKIVVCQFWTKNLSYRNFTYEINKSYCDEKGYIYHIEDDDEKIMKSLDGRSHTWYKPILIRDVFDKYNADYVLFLDADAIICDNSYLIENFIDFKYNIICTEDYGPSKINAGVFIMRNTQWTKKFLSEWWSICDKFEYSRYKTGLWHDQTCFGLLLDNNLDYQENVKIINNSVLNGRVFRDEHNKNFIFHAFSFGHTKNRTIDLAYYKIFNLTPSIKTGSTMEELAEMFPIDKSFEHDYFNRVYDEIFEKYREAKKVMELNTPHFYNSFQILKSYFNHAEIFAVLPSLSNEFKDDEKLNKIILDTSKRNELEKLANEISDFDIIFDDGSHKMFDQQTAFATLFKTLKSGGIYVLEDLHTSIECKDINKSIFGWGDSTKTTTLDMLTHFNSTGKIVSDYINDDEKAYLEETISSCKIYDDRYPNSITCIIFKKDVDVPFKKYDETSIETKELIISSNELTLSDISKTYPTDKDFTHNYYNGVYEGYFKNIKNEVKKLCEIGIGGFSSDLKWLPGNSLRVWRNYFINAEILGLDIVRHKLDDLERITIDWLDQSKRDLVIEYSSKLNDYDIIIDDGSHNVYDQQITFAHFFKSLKSGGIYVLEDLHSSIEVNDPAKAKLWGWGEPGHITPLEMLNHFIETGKIISDDLTEEEKSYLEEHIKNVKIFHLGVTSITSIIIKK